MDRLGRAAEKGSRRIRPEGRAHAAPWSSASTARCRDAIRGESRSVSTPNRVVGLRFREESKRALLRRYTDGRTQSLLHRRRDQRVKPTGPSAPPRADARDTTGGGWIQLHRRSSIGYHFLIGPSSCRGKRDSSKNGWSYTIRRRAGADALAPERTTLYREPSHVAREI